MNNKADKWGGLVFGFFGRVEVFKKGGEISISNRVIKRSATQCTWRNINLV
jgi:hypothetical protein